MDSIYLLSKNADYQDRALCCKTRSKLYCQLNATPKVNKMCRNDDQQENLQYKAQYADPPHNWKISKS